MNHSSSFPAAFLLAMGCVACPGTLDDPSRFYDAAPPGDEAPPQRSVDAGIDAPGNTGCADVPTMFHSTCGTPGCHSAASHTQGLDLETPDVAARLVGVTAMGGGLLIDTSTPDKSVIYTKLTSSPPFGSQMPLGKPALDATALACVHAWVSAQTGPSDAGAE
jgi:hypothetical protein